MTHEAHTRWSAWSRLPPERSFWKSDTIAIHVSSVPQYFIYVGQCGFGLCKGPDACLSCVSAYRFSPRRRAHDAALAVGAVGYARGRISSIYTHASSSRLARGVERKSRDSSAACARLSILQWQNNRGGRFKSCCCGMCRRNLWGSSSARSRRLSAAWGEVKDARDATTGSVFCWSSSSIRSCGRYRWGPWFWRRRWWWPTKTTAGAEWHPILTISNTYHH